MATATSKELFAGDTNDPRVLALRAYIWGHAPLLAARLREQLTQPDDPFATRPPTSPGAALNHLGHQRELSDSSLPGIAPNVDTLYSLAWVDLAEEPFVLEAPTSALAITRFSSALPTQQLSCPLALARTELACRRS